jgi:hypothetical protein
LVPKRVLDFTGLSSGSTEDLILADRVELLHWREVTAQIRVSTHSLSSGAGTIAIRAAAQSWTEEDPTLAFFDDSNAWSVTITSATPSPAYLTFTIPTSGTACLGHMARFTARGNRTAAGALSAQLSLELSLKDS